MSKSLSMLAHSFSFIAFVFLAEISCKPAHLGPSKILADIETRPDPFCGANLFPGVQLSQTKEQIEDISHSVVTNLKTELGPLNKFEKKIYSEAIQMPPYIVHRLPLKSFRAVLKSQSLISPNEGERRKGIKVKPGITPQAEEALYSAFECVFVTINPPIGRTRYGEVMLRFPYEKSSTRLQWATPWSGYFLIQSRRQALCQTQCTCMLTARNKKEQKACNLATDSTFEHFDFSDQANNCTEACEKRASEMRNYKLSDSIQQEFKSQVLVREDWNEYLAFDIVRHLRAMPKDKRKDLES